MTSKFGFYKVGIGNFKIHLADIEENEKEIISLILKSKEEGVNILSFGELSLTGYTCQDLFLKRDFVKKCYSAIIEITSSIPNNMLVAVGAPAIQNNKLYDCAFILTKDKILGIVPKTYLPNYNEFYEKRWFSSAKDTTNDKIEINDLLVDFGTNLIFKNGDIKVGVEICEDLWVINPPSNDLALAGANVILNLSASDEIVSKKEYRKNLVMMQSSKLYCVYIYGSNGFGESSQDLVFSGHSLIYQNGHFINESYDEKGILCGLIDLDLIQNERLKYKSSFEDKPLKEYKFIDYGDSIEINLLPSSYDAHPFILKDYGDHQKRCHEIMDLQAKGLAKRLDSIHISKVVLGISGGLDSTLALLVALKAFEMLDLDKKGIYAITLPGFATSTTTFKNAKKLISLCGVTYEKIDIKKSVKLHLKDLKHDEDNFDVTYENAQARERTQILMDFANMHNAIVVGTGDLSELALGWCTYNADHMSMYNVNSGVPKTLVKYLIEEFSIENKVYSKILKLIIDTPISPELIPSKNKDDIIQKTESIIGKYDLHDFFLFNFFKNGFSKEKIYTLAKIAFKDLDKDYIKRTLDIFYKRFFTQQYKRSCLPDGVKIGSVSLSPRGDFRMASDIDANNSFNK